jgi:hypothetical protein
MTAHKPSRADQAHIAIAEYWREQRAAADRTAKLKEARLAQAKTEPQKARRKTRTPRHRKATGFSRWS